MKEGLTLLSNLVLAKQGSQKFINVPRILRDLQMIQDAKDNTECGGTLIEQLMAGAKAQTDSKNNQQKSDDAVHRKLDKMLTKVEDIEDRITIVESSA